MVENRNIMIIFDTKDITVYNKDINDTTAYTISKRNLKNCWNKIENEFSQNMTYDDVIRIFHDYNMKYRRYCGLD